MVEIRISNGMPITVPRSQVMKWVRVAVDDDGYVVLSIELNLVKE